MSQDTFKALADILVLCRKRPELIDYTKQRLSEILRKVDPTMNIGEHTTPGNAKREIMNHIKSKEVSGEPIKLKSTILREIAATISRTYDIPFNPKQTKKKCDIFKWCDENWTKIKEPFFILLDKHHETSNV